MARNDPSNSTLNDLATKAGLKQFAGWTAEEKRLVLLHDEKTPGGKELKPKHKLTTILPTGDQEGDEKEIRIANERALITYCYEQFLQEQDATRWLETPYVWKKADGKFAHVQTWTLNYNQSFRDAFNIDIDTSTNPVPKEVEQGALDNLRTVAIALFGDEGNEIPIRFVKKTTKNRKPIYVGTTPQFLNLLESPAVKGALNITSVKGHDVTVRIYTSKNAGETPSCCLPPLFGCGTQKLRLSEDPDVVQVLYRRMGYSRFWCLKTQEQFEKEGSLMGFMGG